MAELRSRLADGTAVENLLVVCDFDATLTTGNSDQCHDILGSSPSLPEEVRTAFVPLLDFSKPFPPELAGDGWWVRANDILVSHGAGILAPAIRECVRDSSIELRPGALRLLRRLAELQVPVLIVSAGYSNVIEEVLAADPVTARWCEISSNHLKFGDDGHLVAIEPVEPITSFNKGRTLERNRIWFERHALRKTVLVLGDKPSDLQVMDGAPLDITRFGIGICNDAADDGDSSRHSSFVDYQRVFDAVVCGDKGSLEVVIEVIDGLRPSLLHKPPPPHAPGHAPGDRSMDDGRCDIR
jgi:5'-nucleotidase